MELLELRQDILCHVVSNNSETEQITIYVVPNVAQVPPKLGTEQYNPAIKTP